MGISPADGLPVRVLAWAGNTFDVNGVLPIILYVGIADGSNVYLGMDKFSLNSPGVEVGASFWYPTVYLGEPDFENYRPNLTSLGCLGTTYEWQGGGTKPPLVDKYDVIMIGVIVFWTVIVFTLLAAMLLYHRNQHKQSPQPMGVSGVSLLCVCLSLTHSLTPHSHTPSHTYVSGDGALCPRAEQDADSKPTESDPLLSP